MISDIIKSKKTTISFEVFPPKKDSDFDSAFQTMDALAKLGPDFISVTYGAGGSKSKKTIEIASYIQNTLQIPALAHLTCVGNTRNNIEEICASMKSAGLHHVLALRGDRPQTMTEEQYESREFFHASDLTAFLKTQTDFEIVGACYPEKHYEAPNFDQDLLHLYEKQTAGASFFITQLFFDNTAFYRFMELTQKNNITRPICAGIMPITSAAQLGTTVSLSGSSVPKELADLIATYGDDSDSMYKAGIDYAISQICDLKAHGHTNIHIYTMNKPTVAAEILAGI